MKREASKFNYISIAAEEIPACAGMTPLDASAVYEANPDLIFCVY